MKRRRKLLISLMLIFAMILMSAKTLDVKAADNSGKQKIWSGKEDTSWYKTPIRVSDDGKYSVYEISTAEELAGLGKLVREGNTMENTLILRAYGRLNGRKVSGKMSKVFKTKAL